MKISVEKLYELGACESRIKWFEENVGKGEYDVANLIKMNLYPDANDVLWLMGICPEFRTAEMINKR